MKIKMTPFEKAAAREAARQFGILGGSSRSEKKAAASRANGKLGGAPKKKNK